MPYPPQGGGGGLVAHKDTHIAGGSDAIASYLGSGAIPTISALLIGLDTLNVARIPTLSANKIGSDIFELARIPTMDLAHIPTMPASKIASEVFALAQIPTLDITRIPTLSATRIGADVFETGRIPTLTTGWLGTGVFTLSFVPSLDTGRIPTLDASKISSGFFDALRIPTLSATKIGSDYLETLRIPTLSSTKIGSDRLEIDRLPTIQLTNKFLQVVATGASPTYGDAPAAAAHQTTHLAGASDAIASYLSTNAIPTLSATRIGIDVFETGRIPTLTTGWIGSGVFTLSFVPTLDTGRIPTLDAAKISTGRFTAARLLDGTSGLYLQALGAGADPAYAAVAGLPTIVRKTADEIVNNSDTLQNDDHLLLAIGANEVWLVELSLLLNAISTTPGWKFGWAYPTNCLIYWSPVSWQRVSYGVGGWGVADNALAAEVILRIQTGTVSIKSLAGTRGAVLRALVINGATAGNLVFQWAQITATAEDHTALTNSCLIAHKIA